MAEGRDGLGAVQRLRAFSEATWTTSTDQPEDRRDQESQSSQVDSPWSEKEGELHIGCIRWRYNSDQNSPQPPFETNGLAVSRSEAGTPPFGSHTQRRLSHKASSGASERSQSPTSRAATPSIQHDPNIAPQHLFDGVTLNDHAFQPSPSLPALHLSHPSPGSTSSLIDRHLEPPQTYEQLLLSNNQLKTRVNELELINMMTRESEGRLQKEIEIVRKSEDDLKRRINELEQQTSNGDIHDSAHPGKRARLSETRHGKE
jgi:hypothetical protein